MKDQVDYSLYLVTDNTPAILRGRDLVSVVRAAVEGGVTIVQLRDKTSDTASLVETAKQLHQVTKEYNVPLLINDRVDVALAAGVEGVHIGQDDMDLATARQLLGENAIIGVTASSVEEAIRAAKGGADYLGLGTIFATPTKENTKSIIGTAGLRDILLALCEQEDIADIKTVCIGGINAANCQRVIYQSIAKFKAIDGIAVVSAIIGAEDPKDTAENLRELVRTPPPFDIQQRPLYHGSHEEIQERVPPVVEALAKMNPLCHNMTNLVVQNFAANVALCIGASPIMSNNGLEAKDLASLGGALVINMGTVTPEGLQNYNHALRAYNDVGGPVVFDPVGAGATEQRRNAVKSLLAGGYFDVIKGNENEITTVFAANNPRGKDSLPQQRGVDSAPSTSSVEEKAKLVDELARREKNIVVMTGAVDVLSDGGTTFAIRNGHEYLGAITGSGCTLGTTIAAFLAAAKGEKLVAVLGAVLMYEIAAERAAAREDVKGPGTFVPAFLDELYRIKKETSEGDYKWLEAAKVETINVEDID
ncbi:putative thiamine biosynthetic bifunctional protein [Lasiodiplodia theobromae]|uniref:Putative thiamine biosynthetic bifunctional enzyme n=1 Tax=Lasiodiplodia theobromae TaxID=45133 RepID=A0A5N5DKC1_9PEZI|nr:putative thiamine biosynthetic bifunctional enzyme [Lasiodiplodia theobromae]KAF9637896.1 putative thiamine biosynthetic bifunctional protein [Lasiodiplodia theobromae]